VQVLAGDEGHCVWYGECPKDVTVLNCYYDGPAKKLNNATAANTLIQLCPMLNLSHGTCPVPTNAILLNVTFVVS